MKKMGNVCAAAVILASGILLAGCGKKTDPASEQVLKISITPEATPTAAPEEVDLAAVVTNGNITMVNSYLAEESSGGETASSAEGENLEETGGEAAVQEDAGEE